MKTKCSICGIDNYTNNKYIYESWEKNITEYKLNIYDGFNMSKQICLIISDDALGSFSNNKEHPICSGCGNSAIYIARKFYTEMFTKEAKLLWKNIHTCALGDFKHIEFDTVCSQARHYRAFGREMVDTKTSGHDYEYRIEEEANHKQFYIILCKLVEKHIKNRKFYRLQVTNELIKRRISKIKKEIKKREKEAVYND